LFYENSGRSETIFYCKNKTFCPYQIRGKITKKRRRINAKKKAINQIKSFYTIATMGEKQKSFNKVKRNTY
jgi:hypothetical protein